MVYSNEIQDRLTRYDEQLKGLEAYKSIYDILQREGSGGLSPAFANNTDFIKQKASEYDDIFSKRNLDADVLNQFNQKYGAGGPNYSGDTLSTALPKMTDEYEKNNQEILGKIETLGSQVGAEKLGFFDKIKEDSDKLKAGILGQTQEQIATTEGLNTRRGLGTKAMENISKSSIQNEEVKSLGEVSANETEQLMQVSSLYNQLLTGLITQYKETKDRYVLEKIQNAVNILTALDKYGNSTAG